jgi:tetratricopeptide (TPR) repeat protein
MRKTIALVFALAVFFNVIAQQEIDSLRLLLLNAKEDTVRIDLMNRIGRIYGLTSPDSTLRYGTEALAFARSANYSKGEVEGMRNISVAYSFAGDFSKGLEYALSALKKSDALGDKRLIASSVWAVALVYAGHGDFQRALDYATRATEIYQELHSDADLDKMLMNTGRTYLELDRPDSSRIYFERSLEIALRIKDKKVVAAVYFNLGDVYSKMEQYDIALTYYRHAIPTFIVDSNYSFLYGSYYSLAKIFDSTQQFDSAFYYSRLALANAKKVRSPVNEAEIAKQLSLLFKREGRFDSAFIYAEMVMAATDSLKNNEKEEKVRTLIFNEQLRQMDIAERKRKAAETRRQNLQLAAIAIFIPLFFLFVLLLGRRKVKSRTIEFLGVLSLLFVFEFIVLFAHPYIGRWTHESPILMLMIFVAIATILVPLHHRSENWIKKRLAAKPKLKLQIEPARKT